MKLKGKIMAAALSTIVAASSFSTVTFAENTETYTIFIGIAHPMYSDKPQQPSGTVVVSKSRGISVGESITVTVTPSSGCQIYHFSISPVGYSFDGRSTSPMTHTFTMPAQNVHIQANFSFISSTPDPTPTPTPTPDPTPTPTPTWKKGDADCNGTVNTADATAVLKHIVGITMLSDQGFKNADMDGNGQITTADATAILKLIISKV